MSEIITSDLVPLAERGIYQGLLGLTWSFASGIGPPIVSTESHYHRPQLTGFLQGGSFAEKASWRWLFCEYRRSLPEVFVEADIHV